MTHRTSIWEAEISRLNGGYFDSPEQVRWRVFTFELIM